MSSRAAAVVALVIVLLALVGLFWWSAGGEDESRARPADPTTADTSRDAPAGDFVPYDPQRRIDDLSPGTLPGRSEGPQYVYEQDDRTIVLSAERVEPQPKGVLELVGPEARIWESTDEAVVIEADRGTIVAPENHLHGGEFSGNVSISHYEADDGRDVDLQSDRDLRLRVYLDEADFDMDLGHVQSAGPVRLVGSGIEFRGRGLSLTYNQRRRRLEKLVVYHGEELRLPRPQNRPQSSPAMKPTAGQSEATASAATSSDRVPTDQQAPASSDEVEPTQWYRARFVDDVVVDAPADEARMTADMLDAVFAMNVSGSADAKARDELVFSPRQAGGHVDGEHVGVGDQVVQADDEAPAAAQDQVRVTWSGEFVVEPEPAPPAELAGPDDLSLRLVGQPVMIQGADGATVRAAEVDYLASTGRISATGSASAPLHIESPDLGAVQGAVARIDPARSTGHVLGPGTLTAVTDGSAEPLSVTWQDRLDLNLAVADDDRIRALRDATFRGGVHAVEPRFDLTSKELRVDFSDPAAQPQHLTDITASGSVALQLHDRQAGDVRVDAGELAVQLQQTAEGQTEPAQVIASQDVHAVLPELELWSQTLDVALASGTAASAGERAIDRVIAGDAVRVIEKTQDYELTGQELAYDAGDEQLTVLGTLETPAQVRRPDGGIRGPRIVMNQLEKRVDVDGPGAFDMLMKPGVNDETLRVQWVDRMAFDNRAGKAHFQGDVRSGIESTSESGEDRTRLGAKTLALQFDPLEREDKVAVADESSDGAPANSERRLRFAEAGGEVRFVSESYAYRKPSVEQALRGEHGPANLQTRLTITGPRMTFVNGQRTDAEAATESTADAATEATGQAEQAVRVHGKGFLLIEDYRPADERGADDEPNDAAEAGGEAQRSPVAMSGRGQTLFRWTDNLKLDGRLNDVHFVGDVEMIHKPDDASPLIELYSDRLVADFAGTSGLDVWVDAADADADAQPDLQTVRADGRVRVRQAGSTITADHLQYTAEDQLIRLWGAGERDVVVESQDHPTALRGREVLWDLQRNRFELRQPGGATVPVTE